MVQAPGSDWMVPTRKMISEKTQTDRCWVKCDAFNYSSGWYLKQQLRIGRNAAWHVALVKKNTCLTSEWTAQRHFCGRGYCGNEVTFLRAAQPSLPDIGPIRTEAAINWDTEAMNMNIFTKSASLSHSIRPSCDRLTSLEPLLWVKPVFNINLEYQTCQIHLSGISCSSVWWISHCLQTDFDSASLCNVLCDYGAWILTFRQVDNWAGLMTH